MLYVSSLDSTHSVISRMQCCSLETYSLFQALSTWFALSSILAKVAFFLCYWGVLPEVNKLTLQLLHSMALGRKPGAERHIGIDCKTFMLSEMKSKPLSSAMCEDHFNELEIVKSDFFMTTIRLLQYLYGCFACQPHSSS